MLELLKFFLDKIDFIAIVKFLRERNNRQAAARLHAILVQSYEIIEIYNILLNELRNALETREHPDDSYRFYLNPDRMASLLRRQASNLDVMETLTFDLMDELRILNNAFAEGYRSILPGKTGILFEAQMLLSEGRLPLVEGGPQYFPAGVDGTYRTLWFTSNSPEDDRRDIEKYLYGCDGQEKIICDVSSHDGDKFFRELSRYFSDQNPFKRLSDLRQLTENYRSVLAGNFTISDLLTDVGAIRRHHR